MTRKKEAVVVAEKVTLTPYLMMLSCSKCPATIQGRFTEDPDGAPNGWPQHRCAATRRPAPFTRFEDAPKRGSLHRYAVD